MRVLEASTGSHVSDIGHNGIFLDMTPEARETKAKINYWDYFKIKTFCTAKETANRTKRQPPEREKVFANTYPVKG